MQTHESTTISGIIIPAEWDDQGRILGLAIATYDESRIIIVPNAQAKELMSCLRKAVRVNGILRQKETLQEIEIHTFAIDP